MGGRASGRLLKAYGMMGELWGRADEQVTRRRSGALAGWAKQLVNGWWVVNGASDEKE